MTWISTRKKGYHLKYTHRTEVRHDIAEESKKNIAAVNDYIDNLRGVVISVQTIRAGQPRAYADSIYEALIFCHRPNVFTTGAPAMAFITEEEAKSLAKIFVHRFEDTPKFLEPRLVSIKPEKNPCGLDESSTLFNWEGRAPCWRVVINQPYCD